MSFPAEPVPFSDEVHEHHCKVAGCKHTAVYKFDDGTTRQGWCVLCREVAFGDLADEVER
jgi:hypothetical protein